MSPENQTTILRLLIIRQWYALRRRLPDIFGDGLVAVYLQIIMLKFFLPAMGMESKWQLPLFIGNMLMLCFTIGYQYGVEVTTDIDTSKVMNYHFMLPVASWMIIVSYLFGALITFATLLTPVAIIGITFLSSHAVVNGSALAIVGMGFLITLFFGLFFITLGLQFQPEVYMDHMWPRVLGPMFVLGCLMFTWQRIHSFAPKISYLFLLSPVTYCVEGMRQAILADPQFLSLKVCMTVISTLILLLVFWMRKAVRKRLDVVWARR